MNGIKSIDFPPSGDQKAPKIAGFAQFGMVRFTSLKIVGETIAEQGNVHLLPPTCSALCREAASRNQRHQSPETSRRRLRLQKFGHNEQGTIISGASLRSNSPAGEQIRGDARNFPLPSSIGRPRGLTSVWDDIPQMTIVDSFHYRLHLVALHGSES
jgi:hypothetical protein